MGRGRSVRLTETPGTSTRMCAVGPPCRAQGGRLKQARSLVYLPLFRGKAGAAREEYRGTQRRMFLVPKRGAL